MSKLSLLGILALTFLLGVFQQSLHASNCVDETDQVGGDCTTSRCNISCDSGYGILQSRRHQAIPPLKADDADRNHEQTSSKQPPLLRLPSLYTDANGPNVVPVVVQLPTTDSFEFSDLKAFGEPIWRRGL